MSPLDTEIQRVQLEIARTRPMLSEALASGNRGLTCALSQRLNYAERELATLLGILQQGQRLAQHKAE